MKAILISEDNHGIIGVATTEKAAKKWLIDNGWITGSNKIWNSDINATSALYDLYGDDWKVKYMEFDRDKMEDLGFFLRKIDMAEE